MLPASPATTTTGLPGEPGSFGGPDQISLPALPETPVGSKTSELMTRRAAVGINNLANDVVHRWWEFVNPWSGEFLDFSPEKPTWTERQNAGR